MLSPGDKNFSLVFFHLGLEIDANNLKLKSPNFNDPLNLLEAARVGSWRKCKTAQAEMTAEGQVFRVLDFWLSTFVFYLASLPLIN